MNKLKKALVYIICGYIFTYQFIILKVVGLLPRGVYFEVNNDIGGILAIIGAILEIMGIFYIAQSVNAIAMQKKIADEEIHSLAQGIEQSSEGVVILNIEGHIQYVNASYEKISGVSREKLIGSYFTSIPTPTSSPEKTDIFWVTVLSGKTWKDRITNHHPDCHDYTVEIIVSPIYDLKGNITSLLAGCHDITKELEREQSMIQMQKLESIGSFVGGIAHDFNNILSAIIGNTELAVEDVPTSSPTYSKLRDILFSANRGKEVIQQLVAYSRKEESKAIVTDLQTNIREALKLLKAVIPRSIKITDKLCFCEDKIMAVPGQIHQIIMNLGINSANSMKLASGTIDVTLEKEDINPNTIGNYPELTSIHCYKMTFADSGCGIQPDVLEHIFDSYFTTKPHNESTGLGLSIISNIVKTHEGAIRVESKVGVGTKFTILFPRFEPFIENELFAIKPQITGNSERILFVDDESGLVDIASQYLNKQGYLVKGFTDSKEALANFENNPTSYDLIITDAAMSGLTGMELAERIIGIRPDIPIILATGMIEQITTEEAGSLGIRNILMKPYNTRNLVEQIRKTLDKPNPI